MSAPRDIRIFTISLWPQLAALMTGDQPCAKLAVLVADHTELCRKIIQWLCRRLVTSSSAADTVGFPPWSSKCCISWKLPPVAAEWSKLRPSPSLFKFSRFKVSASSPRKYCKLPSLAAAAACSMTSKESVAFEACHYRLTDQIKHARAKYWYPGCLQSFTLHYVLDCWNSGGLRYGDAPQLTRQHWPKMCSLKSPH